MGGPDATVLGAGATVETGGRPPLFEIRDLRVVFPGGDGGLEAVSGVDLAVERGQVLAVVGESGSGKSVTMLAAMGLTGPGVRVTGSVKLDGEEFVGRPEALRHIRGKRIAMIFQDPMTALNPVLTVGAQIAEMIRIHDRSVSQRQALRRAVELLARVAVPYPERRAAQYPHEFSGGMRQRAMIAMAIANDPDILIADEPTTALDVTIQAQIIELLDELRRERGLGLVLITHDLGIVAGLADSVAILYAGRVVERAPVREAFYRPAHPYASSLLKALPSVDGGRDRLTPIEGSPPGLGNRPSGCAFHPRCPIAIPRCTTERPPLVTVGVHASACHRADLTAERPLPALDSVLAGARA
jgi:oligopeptide/dipeptide ABC transporter ATP-binding protein